MDRVPRVTWLLYGREWNQGCRSKESSSFDFNWSFDFSLLRSIAMPDGMTYEDKLTIFSAQSLQRSAGGLNSIRA